MKPIESKIRDGQVWLMRTEGTTVASSGTGYVGFTTGTKYLRLVNRAIGTDATTGIVNFYINSTYTGGTAIPLSNRNARANANIGAAPLTAVKGPTPDGLDPADIIASFPIRSGLSFPLKAEVDPEYEQIFLDVSQSYILELTNDGGGEASFDIRFEFAEEES